MDTLAANFPDYKQMAFVGRSNCGKSSLINHLLGKPDLLKASKTPGKTSNLHFVDVPSLKLHLVDCPGYGFAVASASEKENWKKFIMQYLMESH